MGEGRGALPDALADGRAELARPRHDEALAELGDVGRGRGGGGGREEAEDGERGGGAEHGFLFLILFYFFD